MKEIAGRVFRHMDRVRLLASDGTVREGRGAVCRHKSASGDALGALGHELGRLQEPLYVFTGSLPQLVPGDLLEQGGERYTVLWGRRVMLGDTLVCTRAVLERRDEDAGL